MAVYRTELGLAFYHQYHHAILNRPENDMYVLFVTLHIEYANV